MSITELIPEYLAAQDALEKRLAELQKEYESPLGESAAMVRRRIETLTDELYDLRLVIKHLMSYRQDGEGAREQEKESVSA